MLNEQGYSETIQRLIDNVKEKPGALLPVLHSIQEAIGYIPKDSIPFIAKSLNLSRAEVHGVIHFYDYFRDVPPGRRTIRICRAESCQAMGGEQLEAHIKKKLHMEYHQTSSDGEFTLEPVYCLGNCACSPSLQIGQEVYGRMTPEEFDTLLNIFQELK